MAPEPVGDGEKSGPDCEEKAARGGGASTRFDDLLRLAGGSGRWQTLHILWLTKGVFIVSWFLTAMVFLGAVPPHRCADGYDEGATYDDLPADTPQCGGGDNTTCSRWVYDRSELVSTMATQWHLVCHRRPLLALIQSLTMLGGLVGASLTGFISDRWGRRPTSLLGSAVYTAAVLTTALVSRYQALLTARFLAGFGCSLSLAPLVVLTMEMLTPEWRLLAGCLIQVPFAIGLMTLAAVAYLLPTWWHLQLALVAPCVLYAADWWLLPESPRWLTVNGRLHKATALLRQIERVNGGALPSQPQLMQMLAEASASEKNHQAALSETTVTGGGDGWRTLAQLVRTPRMRRNTIITWVCWLGSGMVYFGLTFEVGQLSSSRYLANCLSGLSEVPACLLPWLLATQWGRRPAVSALYTLAAGCILASLASRDAHLWLALGLVGKFSATAAFCLLYLYTPEYTPTAVRTLGLGVASVAARVGSAISPFIIESGRQLHADLPTLVFGLMCLVAAGGALMLPETAGRRLPDTAADVECGAWSRQPPEYSEKLMGLIRDRRAHSWLGKTKTPAGHITVENDNGVVGSQADANIDGKCQPK